MKKLNKNDCNKNINIFKYKNIKNKNKKKSDTNSHLDENYNKSDIDSITSSMKRFRTIIGALTITIMICCIFFANKKYTIVYRKNIESGKFDDIKAGDILSKQEVKLKSKDFSIDAERCYGNIELSIWNFSDKEDGDYVQVFINGTPKTEPFAIRHKPIRVGVPDKALIQVKGIRDGSNNGITYAVFFNKTGETYLNTVPLNATNTYTIKTN